MLPKKSHQATPQQIWATLTRLETLCKQWGFSNSLVALSFAKKMIQHDMNKEHKSSQQHKQNLRP